MTILSSMPQFANQPDYFCTSTQTQHLRQDGFDHLPGSYALPISPVSNISANRKFTCISTDEAVLITTRNYSAPSSFSGMLENETAFRHAKTLLLEESSANAYSRIHFHKAPR